MVTSGERWNGDKLGDGTDIYTLLYYKLTSKNLLYSTGPSSQYSIMTYLGIESKNECIYVFI